MSMHEQPKQSKSPNATVPSEEPRVADVATDEAEKVTGGGTPAIDDWGRADPPATVDTSKHYWS